MTAVLLFCLVQAACAPAAPQARAAGTGLVAAVPAGSAARALQAAAAQYSTHSGERVRVEIITGDAYYDRVSAVLLSGADSYDLLYLPADSIARFVKYNALRPIAAQIDQQPLAPWLPPLTFSQDGTERFFALPAQPDPLVLWYRADLRQAANLPDPAASLESFRASALAWNAPPERYGAAMAGSDMDAGQDYAALLAGAPGDLLSAFTGAESQAYARQALAVYAGLISEDGAAPPGAEQFTRGDVIKALREGRAAMGFAPLSASADLLDCDASPKACADQRPLFAAASLPGDEDCAVLENLSVWAIPLRAAHPDAADRFAAWLVSEEGARAWMDGGGLPAHTQLLAAQGQVPAGDEPGGAAGVLLPDGIGSLLGQAACYEYAFPNQPNSDQLWKALHSAAHAAADGDPPGLVFERAVQEMNASLRQEGAVR